MPDGIDDELVGWLGDWLGDWLGEGIEGDGMEEELPLDEDDEDDEGICGMLLDCVCWALSQALSSRAHTLKPTTALTRDLFMII